MHRNVEVLIGRLATDLGLQRRFAERPLEVLREQAVELTEVELEALTSLSLAALLAFSARLDPRIRKASLLPVVRLAGGANEAHLEAESQEESSR